VAQEALVQLRAAQVDVVTFGQYMRPTKGHLAVVEYVTPEGFAHWQKVAEGLGFRYVASGAMVRASSPPASRGSSSQSHSTGVTETGP
jgi:lipoic acid synthetase